MASLSISASSTPRFHTFPSNSCCKALFRPLLPFSAHVRPRAAGSSFDLKPFATSVPDLGLRLELSSPATSTFASVPRATAGAAARGAESDVMGLLLRERIVFLGHEIDDFVADAIISQILLLDAQDPRKDIRLFINSPGGSLSATMAIYDVIQLTRADVSTIALGIAASTSSVILGGGTKGKRFAMPNARIMMHQPLGGAYGQTLDVEIQAKEIMQNKNTVIDIIAGFTGRTFEQVEKDIDRDRYMSPIEAVEYGVIDGVIDEDSIIPLEPVPPRNNKSRYDFAEISKDRNKFLIPEIPDDEIY